MVAPGFVEDTGFFRGALSDARRERLVGQTANGRPGRPEDVAATVRWLLSEQAGHVTRQLIGVNGGALTG